MTVSNLSSYALFQTTLGNFGKVQGTLSEAQIQLSSGQKSQDYEGISSQAQQYLSMTSSIKRTDQYLADNEIVAARLDTTASVMGQVVTTATALQNLVIQRRAGTADNASFDAQLTNLWQQLTGQLNTEIGGRYLFSGSKINERAVDTGNFPSPTVPGVPDSGYYLGSAQDMTVRAQDNIEITYNVRADASGFQKIFAALASARSGGQNSSDQSLSEAIDLVQSGMREVIAQQAVVNSNKVQLATINQSHVSMKIFYRSMQENIGNTDVVAVSTQVAQNQGILQAAFEAFARISSLKLSDFLR